MTRIATTVRPPVNPATDELVKVGWYRAGYKDPWLDSLERDGLQLIPRKLPPELRINGDFIDYRDGVAAYRQGISEYLDKKQKLQARPWWRRLFSPLSVDQKLFPYRHVFSAFADVYVVDPKLAITGLKVYLDPPPISGTPTHTSCANYVVKTFSAIAEHRLPAIPDNVYATALHCLDVLLQTGLDSGDRICLERAREAIAKRK